MSKLYKIIFTSLLLFVLGLAHSQQQEKYIIENITVSGIKYLSPKTIIANSGLKIGDEITIPGVDISNAVKNIWSESLVGNVSIAASEINGNLVSLNIHLTERSRLSQIYIEGVRKGEEKELKESFDVITSQVVSQALQKNIAIQIEKHYKEEGFYDVEVSSPTEKSDTAIDNHVILTYNVTKGPKYKINEIKITGERQIEEKKLKRKLKSTKEMKFWRFWHRSKFIEEEYKVDEQTLIDLYRSKGMRDATISLDSVYINPEDEKNKTLNLSMSIDEGEVYYFRDIVWSGNSKYSDKQLNKILGIQRGDIYNQTELDSKLNFNPTGVDVSSLYLDDGYLFFSVNPTELRVDGDSIDIEMRVYEGNQATIGNVKVFGNTKTSDHVIMREIRTLPGDKFSRSNLIRSQQIIASLGYFDPEQIQIIPTPNPKTGTVDIEYRVVEKPSDQLTLSGGWGGGGGINFVGTLGLVFSNFSLRNVTKPKTWDPLPSGDGQRLSLQAQANGKFFQNYSLSFTEPWLGGKKPNALTVSLNHSLYGRLATTDTEEGDMTISGASVGISRRLRKIDDYFTLSNSLAYSRYNINNFNLSSSTALCETCVANNLNFNTTLARNSAGPNIQYPTEGSNISLSLSLTPPYSLLSDDIEARTGEETYKLIEYNKWMFDFTSYLRLGSRKNRDKLGVKTKKERPFVLQTKYHFGLIGRYNQNTTISPFERFRLGGTGINGFDFIRGTDIISLRGYDENALYPDGGGGVIYNKIAWELRYPFVTEGIATVYGFGFFEAGNNWGSIQEFNPLDLKRSAGGGLSIFMPAFGNISLGYGWGLDDTPIYNNSATNGGRFLFSIGAAIR